MMTENYDSIEDTFDNLDILLFTAKGPISNVIKLFTWSKWSHVGAIIKIKGELYCWESTTLNRSENLSGIVKKGVQLTPLKERISEHKGQVAVKRLNVAIRDIYFLEKLNRFKKKMDGVEYEENYWELFKSTFDVGKLGKNREDLENVFCSELIAEALHRTDIIHLYPPSNEYTPADFDKQLPFTAGNSFLDIKPILLKV